MPLPEAAVLVTAAKKALEVETDADLVFELRTRYGIRVVQSTVNRWGKEGGPGYTTTMALLDAAGWLNQAAIRDQVAAMARASARSEAATAEETARSQAARKAPARGKRKSA